MNHPTPEVRPQLGPLPFGWREHPELPGMIEAVPEEQALLKQAYEYLDKGCRPTAVARWVSAKCGRHLDQTSLRRFYAAQKQKAELETA